MTTSKTRFFLITTLFLSSMYFMVSCTPADTDGDGVPDGQDNCVDIANADQLNSDTDDYGDVCDCDDSNRYVYPTAFEFCNDGIDNQCPGDAGYGNVDEACEAQIPAGCFDMGDSSDSCVGDADECPVHEVCISAFEMDIHEVTNAEYAECVDDGGCTVPSDPDESFSVRASYYGDPVYDDFPVILVDWYQAADYCTWAGKRLPTEAEWEYAARGGLESKRFPWGDTISGTDANFWGSGDPWDNDTSPVGYYAPNDYGLYDMAGNVWEWVADWYQYDYYAISPLNDPQGPVSGTNRVLRGGSWYDSNFTRRVAVRTYYVQAYESLNGVRCAR